MKKEFHKTKEEIERYLNQYEIKSYTLIPDKKYGYIVDVNGDVNLSYKNLDCCLVKFNQINGDFFCNNNFTNLEFCPQKIGTDFYCHNNQLSSLEFCPPFINGDFSCLNNKLECLKNKNSFSNVYKLHLDWLKEIEYEKLNEIVDVSQKMIKKNKI